MPYCGLVQSSPDAFVRVPFFTGMQVLSVLAGPDFSLCLVRPREAAGTDSSPLSPAAELGAATVATGEGDSCPLGLPVKSGAHLRPFASPKLDLNRNMMGGTRCDQNDGCDIFYKETGSKSKDHYDVVDGDISSPRRIFSDEKISTPLESRKLPPDTLSLNSLPSDDLFSDVSEVGKMPVGSTPSPPAASCSLSLDDLEWRETTTRLAPSRLHLAAKRSASVGALCQKGFRLNEAGPEDLAAEGQRLRSTEVWGWGSGGRGQLAQGDMLARPTPAAVPGLQGQFIIKLAVGAHHALALTGSGLVYGWGDNSQGQACPTDTLAVVLHPARIQIPREETARDVAASGCVSAVLTDSGKIYVCGGGGSGKGGGSSKSSRLRVIPAAGLVPGDSRPLAAFCLPGFFVLNTGPACEQTAASLVSREKVMLLQVDAVLHLIHTLFPPAVSPPPPTMQAVEACLLQASRLLSACVNRSAGSGCRTYCQTGLYRHCAAWEGAVRALFSAVCNCIAVDGLFLDAQQAHHQHLITELLVGRFGLPQSAVQGQVGLEQILLQVVKVTDPYAKALAALLYNKKRASSEESERDVEEEARLKGLESRLSSLMALGLELERERQDAERTRHFWKSVGGSSARQLEAQLPPAPARRLVLDSRYQPVSLVGAMTKHWFLLMSDVLIDYGYQLVVHPVQTIWVESLPSSSSSSRYQSHNTGIYK